MHWTHKLTDEQKNALIAKTNQLLLVVHGSVSIGGPMIMFSKMRSPTHEEKRTDHIYDFIVTGDLDEIKFSWGFDSDRDLEEQINHAARVIAIEYWSAKDGNLHSRLAESIWGE